MLIIAIHYDWFDCLFFLYNHVELFLIVKILIHFIIFVICMFLKRGIFRKLDLKYVKRP